LTCTPVDGQLVSDTKQVPVFELQARRQQNPDEQSAGKFSNPFEEPDANEELAAVDVVLSPANIMFLLDMRACGLYGSAWRRTARSTAGFTEKFSEGLAVHRLFNHKNSSNKPPCHGANHTSYGAGNTNFKYAGISS
jgi:hypothetical protein